MVDGRSLGRERSNAARGSRRGRAQDLKDVFLRTVRYRNRSTAPRSAVRRSRDDRRPRVFNGRKGSRRCSYHRHGNSRRETEYRVLRADEGRSAGRRSSPVGYNGGD